MFEATGARGKLMVGVKTAAILAFWSLVRGVGPLGASDMSALTGKTRYIDIFWSTQRATLLAIQMGRSWWTWRTFEVLSMSPVLSIRLQGDPEVQEWEP